MTNWGSSSGLTCSRFDSLIGERVVFGLGRIRRRRIVAMRSVGPCVVSWPIEPLDVLGDHLDNLTIRSVAGHVLARLKSAVYGDEPTLGEVVRHVVGRAPQAMTRKKSASGDPSWGLNLLVTAI